MRAEFGFPSPRATYALSAELSGSIDPVSSSIGEDEVSGTLPDHDRRRIRVAGSDHRHYRCVCDPQALDAVDAQPRIDDRKRIAAQLAGADLMVVRDRRLSNVLIDVARRRVLLDDAPVAERISGADTSAQLDGRDEALDVPLAREDVRVERDWIAAFGPVSRRVPGSAGGRSRRAA